MVTVQEVAGKAWVFRAQVEHDAAERFERLAPLVASVDPGSPAIEPLRRAASDERRHCGLCAGLALQLAAPLPARWSRVEPIVPPRLDQREAVLYELVAASCIAETESMATLTSLFAHAKASSMESAVGSALRAIAHDEVRHAQLGWAHLARARKVMNVSFLADLLPAMLSGSIDDGFFGPASDAASDDAGLLALGVLPHSMKREVFVTALDEVILPGFRLMGVNDSPARAWLAQHQAAHAWPERH